MRQKTSIPRPPRKPAKYLLTIAIAASTLFTGCGMKGGLTIPPGSSNEPLLGNPKPAAPATKNKPADDTSTGKDTAR